MADLTASTSTQLRKLRLDNGFLEVTIDGGLTWSAVGLSLATSFFETGLIDLTVLSAGNPTIIVPAKTGKKWRTDWLRCRLATNTISITTAVVSLGTIGGSFADLINANNAFGGATAAGSSYEFPLNGAVQTFPVVDVGTLPVVVNVQQAGTGGVGTASWQIWGEYI